MTEDKSKRPLSSNSVRSSSPKRPRLDPTTSPKCIGRPQITHLSKTFESARLSRGNTPLESPRSPICLVDASSVDSERGSASGASHDAPSGRGAGADTSNTTTTFRSRSRTTSLYANSAVAIQPGGQMSPLAKTTERKVSSDQSDSSFHLLIKSLPNLIAVISNQNRLKDRVEAAREEYKKSEQLYKHNAIIKNSRLAAIKDHEAKLDAANDEVAKHVSELCSAVPAETAHSQAQVTARGIAESEAKVQAQAQARAIAEAEAKVQAQAQAAINAQIVVRAVFESEARMRDETKLMLEKERAHHELLQKALAKEHQERFEAAAAHHERWACEKQLMIDDAITAIKKLEAEREENVERIKVLSGRVETLTKDYHAWKTRINERQKVQEEQGLATVKLVTESLADLETTTTIKCSELAQSVDEMETRLEEQIEDRHADMKAQTSAISTYILGDGSDLKGLLLRHDELEAKLAEVQTARSKQAVDTYPRDQACQEMELVVSKPSRPDHARREDVTTVRSAFSALDLRLRNLENSFVGQSEVYQGLYGAMQKCERMVKSVSIDHDSWRQTHAQNSEATRMINNKLDHFMQQIGRMRIDERFAGLRSELTYLQQTYANLQTQQVAERLFRFIESRVLQMFEKQAVNNRPLLQRDPQRERLGVGEVKSSSNSASSVLAVDNVKENVAPAESLRRIAELEKKLAVLQELCSKVVEPAKQDTPQSTAASEHGDRLRSWRVRVNGELVDLFKFLETTHKCLQKQTKLAQRVDRLESNVQHLMTPKLKQEN